MNRPEDMTRDDLEEEVAFLRGEMGLSVVAEQVQRFRHSGIPPSAARMLLALYSVAPRPLTKSQLLDAIMGSDPMVQIVDVHVHRIRRVLGADVIETLWGSGYRLTPIGVAAVGVVLAEDSPENDLRAALVSPGQVVSA